MLSCLRRMCRPPRLQSSLTSHTTWVTDRRAVYLSRGWWEMEVEERTRLVWEVCNKQCSLCSQTKLMLDKPSDRYGVFFRLKDNSWNLYESSPFMKVFGLFGFKDNSINFKWVLSHLNVYFHTLKSHFFHSIFFHLRTTL